MHNTIESEELPQANHPYSAVTVTRANLRLPT